jgi:hypothetical protein
MPLEELGAEGEMEETVELTELEGLVWRNISREGKKRERARTVSRVARPKRVVGPYSN